MGLIDAYLVETVSHQSVASVSASGKKTYNAATTLPTKIVYKEVLFKDPQDSARRVSNTQIILNGAASVSLGDRITISGINYDIGMININRMFSTIDHKTVYLV